MKAHSANCAESFNEITEAGKINQTSIKISLNSNKKGKLKSLGLQPGQASPSFVHPSKSKTKPSEASNISHEIFIKFQSGLVSTNI